MIDKEILFVCATPDNRPTFEANSTFWKSIERRAQIDYQIYYSNTTGLSQVYNEALKEFGPGYDYIVFVHDDVSIEDSFVLQKLCKAHETYDIVGLAGGLDIVYNPSKPPLWHLMTQYHHGAVAHPTQADGGLTVASFGPTPAKCHLVDGLFISVNTKALAKASVSFNEDMTFHFYDLALCMNARRANLKIGVWPIWVVHQGLGDSFKSISWEQCAEKFVKQYLPR